MVSFFLSLLPCLILVVNGSVPHLPCTPRELPARPSGPCSSPAGALALPNPAVLDLPPSLSSLGSGARRDRAHLRQQQRTWKENSRATLSYLTAVTGQYLVKDKAIMTHFFFFNIYCVPNTALCTRMFYLTSQQSQPASFYMWHRWWKWRKDFSPSVQEALSWWLERSHTQGCANKMGWGECQGELAAVWDPGMSWQEGRNLQELQKGNRKTPALNRFGTRFLKVRWLGMGTQFTWGIHHPPPSLPPLKVPWTEPISSLPYKESCVNTWQRKAVSLIIGTHSSSHLKYRKPPRCPGIFISLDSTLIPKWCFFSQSATPLRSSFSPLALLQFWAVLHLVTHNQEQMSHKEEMQDHNPLSENLEVRCALEVSCASEMQTL